MATELFGWNFDGWYADEAVAADMCGWYSEMDDVAQACVVHSAAAGGWGILYMGEPFTFDHSGRYRSSLSEEAKRRLHLRETLLPDESAKGLDEIAYMHRHDDDNLVWREIRRERRMRAHPKPGHAVFYSSESFDIAEVRADVELPEPSRPDSEPACVTFFNANYTWTELLEGDGWTLGRVDTNGEEHWVRPGKSRREGSSATVGYAGNQNMLYVFSSSIPWLPVRDRGRGYDRWGYFVFRDYAGDFAAAVREEMDILETVRRRER